MFQDRTDAGRRLAARLRDYTGQDAVLLAIPRGGVAVAAEVAAVMGAPLDLIIPRKIGAPENEELAIGAVAGLGEIVINESLIDSLQISDDYLKKEAARQLKEIERRRRLYLGDRPEKVITNKTAIIVDDGLATGSTARAAILAVKSKRPKKIVLAVPVAPREAIELLKKEVDELICLKTPELFYAVGQFYERFDQVSDGEVVDILSRLK